MLTKRILKKIPTSELEIELLRRTNTSKEPARSMSYSNMVYQLYQELNVKAIQKDAKERFEGIMSNVHKKCHLHKKHSLQLLRSFRKMISLDIAYSYMPQIIYTENEENAFYLSLPFSYIEEGKVKYLKEEVVNIDLDDKILVTSPYDTCKWLTAIVREEDFDPELSDQGIPLYYPELNVVMQGSGTVHRTADAFLNRTGQQIKVIKFDDKPLYENISTDGVHWFGVSNREEFVQDYRLALIFELRKLERESLLVSSKLL